MGSYGAHGYNEFIVCLGYKGYMIKEYFANYYLHTSDVTFHVKTNAMTVHQSVAEPWTVTLIDTGDETSTGGRLKRIEPFVEIRNVLHDLRRRTCVRESQGSRKVPSIPWQVCHGYRGAASRTFRRRPHGAIASSAVSRKARRRQGMDQRGIFRTRALCFYENRRGHDGVEPGAAGGSVARRGVDGSYQHKGFWHALDTLRDKNALEAMWESGEAPWRLWQ